MKMNRKVVRSVICVLLALIFIVSLMTALIPINASAASQSEINQLTQQRKELQAKQKEQQKTINNLRSKKASVVDQKAALDQENDLAQQEIEVVKQQITAYDQQIEDKGVELEEAKQEEEAQTVRFRGCVRHLEEYGQMSYIAILLEATSLSDLLARMDMVGAGIPSIQMIPDEMEIVYVKTPRKDGPHGAAGVACADCHMPYQRMDGKKMSSHWMTSPLKDKEMRACRQCHADKTPEYLRERVIYTQKKTFDQLLKAQDMSVKAHEAVRLANNYSGERAPDYGALMTEAREMVRKGQLFWDYVSAENSVGFHNPAKALDTLMTSMECSQKAVDLASQATNYGIAPALAGDIKKIVPPILEMSRKLQQDPEYLKTNPWLQLLPVLPKTDAAWDGQERLNSGK